MELFVFCTYAASLPLPLLILVQVLIFLPDSPATATFLNERERKIAIERIRSTQGGTVQHSFKRDQIKETLQDVKTWLVVAISLISSIPNGGLSNFTSLLIRGFGYTSRQSLLLQMPGGLVAFLTTIGVCFLASVKKQRMLPILVAVCPTIFGAVLLVAFDVDPNKYKSGAIVAIVLVSMYGSSLAVLYSWTAANVAGSSKKACTNGLLMTAFGLGNIIGTEIVRPLPALNSELMILSPSSKRRTLPGTSPARLLSSSCSPP